MKNCHVCNSEDITVILSSEGSDFTQVMYHCQKCNKTHSYEVKKEEEDEKFILKY